MGREQVYMAEVPARSRMGNGKRLGSAGIEQRFLGAGVPCGARQPRRLSAGREWQRHRVEQGERSPHPALRVSVILTPKGADAPLVAVAAVMLAAAFTAVCNIPIAAIAIVPVFANHLGLLLRPREV